MNYINDYNGSFLRSSLTEGSNTISTTDAIRWIRYQNAKTIVNVDRIPLLSLVDWLFDKQGNLCHKSGKFFSIEGLSVKTNYGNISEWQQPIINQPEIGFLGIITKEIDGVLYFLMQAKVEPGNINNVQLSPTLQAV